MWLHRSAKDKNGSLDAWPAKSATCITGLNESCAAAPSGEQKQLHLWIILIAMAPASLGQHKAKQFVGILANRLQYLINLSSGSSIALDDQD